MAIQTGSIGNQEDVFQYDDTETYSDAVGVVGLRVVRVLVSTTPSVADDVVRLADLGSLFAPHDAQYVTLTTNSNLTNERVLTAGAGMTLTDGGANSTVTLDVVATSNGGILVNANDIQLDINSLVSTTLSSGDFLAFEDISGGKDKKVPITTLAIVLSSIGFADNTFNIFDNADTTKILKFNVGANVTTGTTRTLTVPDTDSTIIVADGTTPFSGDQSFGDNNATNVGNIALDSISADATNVDITAAAGGEVSVNTAEIDVNFRVAGASVTDLLFIDAANDRIGFNIGAPTARVHMFEGTMLFQRNDTFGAAMFAIEQGGTGNAGLNFSDPGTRNYVIGQKTSDNSFRFSKSNDSFTDANTFIKVTSDTDVGFFDTGTGRGATPTVAAQVHIEQSDTAGAQPVLLLRQADVDEDYFKFIGTSDTSADRALVDAADFTTPGALVGMLKINIQDDQGTNPIPDGDYYLHFFAVPTA